MAELTHLDEHGKARRADVSAKAATQRVALAVVAVFCFFGRAARADEPGGPTDFAYVAGSQSGEVSQFGIGSDGTLLPLSPANVLTGLGAIQSGIAVSSTGRFVYVTNRNRDTISQFRADTDGTLTPLPGGDVPTSPSPEAITFHPAGKFVYVVGKGSISEYQVAVTGHLKALSPPAADCPYGTKRLALDALGRFAYAAGTGGVRQYKISAEGVLDPLPADAATGNFPVGMVVSPQGFAYVACWSGLFQYKVGAAGALAPLSPANAPAEKLPVAITMDPRGHRVYVVNHVNNGNGTVAQYVVGADGGLTRTADALLATGQGPSKAGLDPSGHFLYVANDSDSSLSRFALAADSSLQPLTPMTLRPLGSIALARHSPRFIPAPLEAQPPAPSTSPPSLEFKDTLAQHPEFVYVANTSRDSISQFRVQADGTLAALGARKTGSQPLSIALEPTGRFAYVACAGNQHVWQYQIRPDGYLAPLNPPIVYSGDWPFSIAATPDSRFVYAVNRSDGTVSQFRIGADGALTPLASPIKTGAEPQVITVAPNGKSVYVLCAGNDRVSRFEIGAAGALTEIKPSFGTSGGGIPSVPTFSAGGFAYVTTTNQAIWQNRVDPSGALTPLTPESFHAAKQLAYPAALAVAAGKFLYSSNQFDNSLSGYRIGPDGTLSPLSPALFPTGAGPGPLVADPSGHFLYVLNSSNRAITQYQIAPTGELALLTPAQVPAGLLSGVADPNAIAIVRR